jgi:DNA-binding CsgD family transcriptional regulator
LNLADETGNYGFRLNARMVLAAVATYRSDLTELKQLIAVEEGEQGADEGLAHRLRMMRGWVKANTGDFAGAVETLAPLLDSAEFRDPWPWAPPWMRLLARIGLDAGNREFAGKAADIADLVAQRNLGVATLEGTALHIRGLLADDPAILGDAVRTLRQSPRPLLLADALKDHGSTLLAHRRPDEGAHTLAEAAEIYQRIGAISGSHAVSKLLRSHGIRGIRIYSPALRPTTGWAALTPTELRVVDLISSGHTNRSAAGELGVSSNTVNTHLRAVFRKLDVKSRVQLTIAFREHRANSGGTA